MLQIAKRLLAVYHIMRHAENSTFTASMYFQQSPRSSSCPRCATLFLSFTPALISLKSHQGRAFSLHWSKSPRKWLLQTKWPSLLSCSSAILSTAKAWMKGRLYAVFTSADGWTPLVIPADANALRWSCCLRAPTPAHSLWISASVTLSRITVTFSFLVSNY